MIYILIPVHNRIQATMECLACIAKQTLADYQVIIINDGSTDDTTTLITKRYPKTTILAGDGTLWWAGAIDKGIDYVLAHASDNDFILSLNNDVTFGSDYLEQLHKASLVCHQAVVGSLCRDETNHDAILDSGIVLDWKKYKYNQLPYNRNSDVATNVDTISGRGLLIPVTVIKQIGNFAHERFPHYGADYAFGFRVKAVSIPMIVSYQAVVYLKNDLTGFRPTATILSYTDSWKRLFSIKSPTNLMVHLKTIYYYCPNLFLTILNLSYFLAGNIYLSLRSAFLYTLVLLSIIHPSNDAKS